MGPRLLSGTDGHFWPTFIEASAQGGDKTYLNGPVGNGRIFSSDLAHLRPILPYRTGSLALRL